MFFGVIYVLDRWPTGYRCSRIGKLVANLFLYDKDASVVLVYLVDSFVLLYSDKRRVVHSDDHCSDLMVSQPKRYGISGNQIYIRPK